MKKTTKLAGIIAFTVIMCFSFAACDFINDLFKNCDICGENPCVCPPWKEFIGTWTNDYDSKYVITKDSITWIQSNGGVNFTYSIESGVFKSNLFLLNTGAWEDYPNGYEFKGPITKSNSSNYKVGETKDSRYYMHKDKKSFSDEGWTILGSIYRR